MASRKLTLVATQLLAAALAVVPAPRVHAGSTYKVLHNFGSGQDGSLPYGPPLLDKKGNVYGVTFNGGTGKCSDYGCGAVFELIRSRNGWSEKLLHSFTSAEGSPWGPLIYDQAGNVYGTSVGGPISNSEVFELSPTSNGWSFSALYTDGAGPGVVLDRVGNVYGAIGPANYYGIGAIGELSPGSQGWTYTDLGNFNPTVGYAPPAPPVWDTKGNLYGTTHYGGIGRPKCTTSFGCGVIFRVASNHDGTWTYQVLHRFASYPADGQNPLGGLVMDASGNFYGTTEGGGPSGAGTVFKFAFVNGHWRKTVLYGFPDCADGCIPGSTPVLDKAGNLYGAASGGNQGCGPDPCGTIFKLSPHKNGKWSYSVLHRFSGPDGNFPWGVVVDGKGNIFGTTESGGTYNAGTAFEITP
jgi:uncharacterized repeat protein (TIGR03803 family)